MQLDPRRASRAVRCDRCRRQLRVPRQVRLACRRCGWQADYGPAASGRRVRCRQCGAAIDAPVQMARPRRHRRRSRGVPSGSGFLSVVVSLGAAIVGLILFFRVISHL